MFLGPILICLHQPRCQVWTNLFVSDTDETWPSVQFRLFSSLIFVICYHLHHQRHQELCVLQHIFFYWLRQIGATLLNSACVIQHIFKENKICNQKIFFAVMQRIGSTWCWMCYHLSLSAFQNEKRERFDWMEKPELNWKANDSLNWINMDPQVIQCSETSGWPAGKAKRTQQSASITIITTQASCETHEATGFF